MSKFKSLMLSIVLMLIAVVFAPVVMAAVENNANTAVYRVTFVPTFTLASHPYRWQKSLHFTPWIIGSYKKGYDMYKVGTKATRGLKLMAEKGKISTLRREMLIAKRNGLVYSIASYNSNSYDEVVNSTIKMSKDFPLVAATTMIGPSPDWFVGVSDVKLYHKNGGWVPSKTVIAYAYDSGTDAGADYRSKNKVEKPVKDVELLRTKYFLHNGKLNPVATVIFTRLG